MSRVRVIEGIKCYSPESAEAYDNYPDRGFDLTDKAAPESFWVRSRNRLFQAMIRRCLKPSGKSRILEIGCGTGEFLTHIADDDRLDITGSEVYLKGLHYAKRNLPRVEFVQLDVARDVTDGIYDMICAFDVIEHVDEDEAAIANVARMLEPDGVFLVSVPQHRFLWSHLDEIVMHKRRYSRADLVGKLTRNGFRVEYATSFLFTLFPLMLVSRLLDRKGAAPAEGEGELERRVQFSPLVTRIFDTVMRVDEFLIRLGLSLPFGGTLLVIARKDGYQ